MENKEIFKVTRTDLVRDAGEVFDGLMRGGMAMIEKRGKPQAILIDIYDFYCLRAAAFHGINRVKITKKELEEFVKSGPGEDELHVKVIGKYLAKGITLEKAAELLGIPSLELKSRFLRLHLPIREGNNNA
jgi:hypothetical protein